MWLSDAVQFTIGKVQRARSDAGRVERKWEVHGSAVNLSASIKQIIGLDASGADAWTSRRELTSDELAAPSPAATSYTPRYAPVHLWHRSASVHKVAVLVVKCRAGVLCFRSTEALTIEVV